MSLNRYPIKVVATSVEGNVTGSVASVTGNVGGNVTGSVGSIPTIINSIQRGTITLSTTSGTTTISTINTSKSFLNITGFSISGNFTGEYYVFRGVITNTTTLTFYLGAYNGGTPTISWEVIEFK